MIKIFTAMVYYQSEESPLIVLRSPFETENIVYGMDSDRMTENFPDRWFSKGKMIVLIKTNDNAFVISVYKLLINSWWIISILISVYMIYYFNSENKRR